MTGRCDITDLHVNECAHCRKLPDLDANPATNHTRGDNTPGPDVEARWPGHCSACGDTFGPGQTIRLLPQTHRKDHMNNLKPPQHIAAAGEHTSTEVMWRITTPSGQINDHGPYQVDPNTPLTWAPAWRRPPGSTVTKLVRTVTTIAGAWQAVDDAPQGDAR